MAVKVMVASSIAQLANGRGAKEAKRDAGATARPKRRRSSVYDAEGNEVFITLMCLKCHKMRPLSQFGLRRMADGAIRNQPWCRSCRSASGERPARKGSAETVEPSVAVAPSAPSATEPGAEPRRPGNVAAEVAAALAAGMRR